MAVNSTVRQIASRYLLVFTRFNQGKVHVKPTERKKKTFPIPKLESTLAPWFRTRTKLHFLFWLSNLFFPQLIVWVSQRRKSGWMGGSWQRFKGFFDRDNTLGVCFLGLCVKNASMRFSNACRWR